MVKLVKNWIETNINNINGIIDLTVKEIGVRHSFLLWALRDRWIDYNIDKQKIELLIKNAYSLTSIIHLTVFVQISFKLIVICKIKLFNVYAISFIYHTNSLTKTLYSTNQYSFSVQEFLINDFYSGFFHNPAFS